MRDRVVGGQVPTDKQLQGLIADVMSIQKRIEGFTVTLTAAQRRSTTKMRPGGEKIVATLVQLAEQHALALPQVSGAGMAANQEMVQRLRPLQEASRQLARRLDDTITNAQSESWWAATAMYTALARVATATPDLEAALEPIVSFFAQGRRKKAAPPAEEPPAAPTPPTPAPTPPAAPPSGPSTPPTDKAA